MTLNEDRLSAFVGRMVGDIGAAMSAPLVRPGERRGLCRQPFANDRVEDNLDPVGRVYQSASTMICTPCSLSQEVGLGLGAQAGERPLRSVATDAGFNRFRRATETPFNLVFGAQA